MRGIGAQEILLILVLLTLLFGASRLPKLARSLREARDELERGEREGEQTPAEDPKPAS